MFKILIYFSIFESFEGKKEIWNDVTLTREIFQFPTKFGLNKLEIEEIFSGI